MSFKVNMLDMSKNVEIIRKEIEHDLRSGSRIVSAVVLLRAFKRQASFLSSAIIFLVEGLSRLMGNSKEKTEAIEAIELKKNDVFERFINLVIVSPETRTFEVKFLKPLLEDMISLGWTPSEDCRNAMIEYMNSYIKVLENVKNG